MGLIKYEALLGMLAKKPLRGGAFFFLGDEAFLREEAVDRVVDAYLDPTTRDFNLDQLRGDDADAESLASILSTPPMMAEWRVMVLRDAQALTQKARDVVESVATAPPPGLAFVITAVIPGGSKAKFYPALKKAACSVEFAAIDPLDAPGWLIEQAQTAHRIGLAPDAARALVAALGTDLRMLSGELEKLATFADGRAQLTVEDVRALTGAIPRYDRWEWFDLIGERKFAEALRQLPVLLAAGESGVGLIIGMSAQLLRIGLVCAGGSAALERELKPYQRWLSKRIVPQARRWSVDEVDRGLTEMLRTDRLLKSASLTDRQAMEELLLRLHTRGGIRDTAA
ncbi:DNA polymerase III subunit delta [soil metagenome]|nr:DNA polymerase III subunit delta [Gemmatimonadota bacterium]